MADNVNDNGLPPDGSTADNQSINEISIVTALPTFVEQTVSEALVNTSAVVNDTGISERISQAAISYSDIGDRSLEVDQSIGEVKVSSSQIGGVRGQFV
jgi:hypothetical protein